MVQHLSVFSIPQYEDAIDQFECARELADLVSRGSFNVLARRNAAACLNNKGVCHSVRSSPGWVSILWQNQSRDKLAYGGGWGCWSAPRLQQLYLAQHDILARALHRWFFVSPGYAHC